MLADSERFAFETRRLHGFANTGNAYDACQCDEAIATGDTLVVLSEGVIGLAWTWPVAVTAEHGALHSARDDLETTLEGLAKTLTVGGEDIRHAVELARALQLPVDPTFDRVCPARR